MTRDDASSESRRDVRRRHAFGPRRAPLHSRPDGRGRDRGLRLPNRIGVPGEDLPHVSHYYTQPHPFFRKKVVIVGGKNSAAEAALDLYRAGAQGHDRPPPDRRWGTRSSTGSSPTSTTASRKARFAARFNTRVVEIRPTSVVVERDGVVEEIDADAVFLLTGYGSDTTLLRNAGIEIDAATCGPVFDAETFETNVPGLYTVGAMVAGVQSGRIFIENGRFHGEKVIEAIAARAEA